MKPDITQAAAFLALLDSSPNAQFTFQTFDDKKSGKKFLNQCFHGTLAQHAEKLIKLNLQGAGVCVMVNEGDSVVREGGASSRSSANVKRVRAVFVDLDGAPIEPVLAAALKPQIVVETSPKKYHAYWPVIDFPIERFTSIQAELAEKFTGDTSIKDLARVMRIPGFIHQKKEPFLSKLLIPSIVDFKTGEHE